MEIHFIPMVTGDCIQIRQADVKTKILKLNHLSFVEVLRRKMRDTDQQEEIR